MAAPLVEEGLALFEEGRCLPSDIHLSRQAARLMGDIGREREKLLALIRIRFRPHAFDTFAVDHQFQIDDAVAGLVVTRKERCDAAHGLFRIVMAGGAGEALGSVHFVPEGTTVIDREHSGIQEIVVLQGACLVAEIEITGSAAVDLEGRGVPSLRKDNACSRDSEKHSGDNAMERR